MGVEIERKFLVRGDSWKENARGVLLRQGYLASGPDRVVRVRVQGELAWLTIKGPTKGASRDEWEYPVPIDDAQALLDRLCERPIIEKYRYRIRHGEMVWEVDEFLGENAGLVVAEVELDSEEQALALPDWAGMEVTHDSRYFNASLLRHPYSRW